MLQRLLMKLKLDVLNIELIVLEIFMVLLGKLHLVMKIYF